MPRGCHLGHHCCTSRSSLWLSSLDLAAASPLLTSSANTSPPIASYMRSCTGAELSTPARSRPTCGAPPSLIARTGLHAQVAADVKTKARARLAGEGSVYTSGWTAQGGRAGTESASEEGKAQPRGQEGVSDRSPFTLLQFQTRFGRCFFCIQVSAQADGALISHAQKAVGEGSAATSRSQRGIDGSSSSARQKRRRRPKGRPWPVHG